MVNINFYLYRGFDNLLIYLKIPILIRKLIITKIIRDIGIRKSPDLISYYYGNRNWDKAPLYLVYFKIILSWCANK